MYERNLVYNGVKFKRCEMKDYLKYFDECVFRFESKNNIIEDKELGITSSISAILTPESSVTHLRGLQACPYTNTAMSFDVRVGGERVRATDWTWLPTAIIRRGECERFGIQSLTTLIHNGRGAIEKIKITNKTKDTLTLSLQAMYRGTARHESDWNFSIPTPTPTKLEHYFEEERLVGSRLGGVSFMITTSLSQISNFRLAYILEGKIEIPAGESREVYYSVHIGPEAECRAEAESTYGHYEELIEKSFDYLKGEVDRIHSALPSLHSDNPDLDAFYYRCLVTYILNRWDNPDLCVMPYFSTGSVNGACMCSYLWDWCGGLMLHPVYDKEANKTQIRALLRNDLTKSYALNPVTAGPTGPWYQVNQEKIILMVYHHVLATGEKEFLHEKVNGKTVIEHMREQAYVCDDISREVSLYDYGMGKLEPRRPGWLGDDYIWYGEGNAHLELRRGITYHGIMPDLNARRYMNYMRVYELTCVAGEPDELLPKRASALKKCLKELWNDEAGWYDYIAGGKRDIRYTVQMFKFLNSDVIDGYERERLIAHLNDEEFLSEFGLHSMSKKDIAYDQDDIDNGGGGICTHFTNQICAQLYETGNDALASDILRRILWWGTRLPYMGDSCAANMMMNREDTPLQGDISSVSGAQMIFYYVFGIRPQFDGSIKISPVKYRPAINMTIENARLCGKNFSVSVEGDSFKVLFNGETRVAKIGETITI